MIRLHRRGGKTAQTEARNARMASAVALRGDGLTRQQISVELGVSAGTIQRYFEDHKEKRGPRPGLEPKAKPKTYKRRCLSCDNKMEVDSPYRRMCGVCKSNARGAML